MMSQEEFNKNILPKWSKGYKPPKPKVKRGHPEQEIQRAILDYLTLKNIFHWRNQTGATRTQHGSFIRYGAVGSPDIFAIKDGELYGLEVKSPKGRQSPAQKQWEKEMTEAGAQYAVVRSVEDVIKIL